jgi:hypothetical protein
VDPAGADTFVSDAENGHMATVRLGFNILGHASLEGTFSGTGWRLTEISRGGAGFLGGAIYTCPQCQPAPPKPERRTAKQKS